MTNDTAENDSTEDQHSDSNDTGESAERTDPFETLHPAFRPVVTVVVKFLWIVGQLIVVGSAVAFSYLTERERRIRARRWLLLDGNRWAIVGGLVGSVVVVALVGGLTDVVGVSEPGFITNLFGGIISGLFSFVPIVVAVNQLTISELFGTPTRLRKRIESVQKFRGTVEERLPDVAVSPTDPGAFLAVAARVLSRDAESLREAAAESGDAGLQERIDEYVDGVVGQVEQLKARTEEENLPLIEVLLPVMGDGYAENINAARRIQSECAAMLTARADDLLDDLREMYVGMSILRQYYKALYIQQELARLSQLIVYSGLASFLVSAFLILTFADGAPPGGHGLGMLVFVSAALGIAFSPFAVLFSFILRIATIAKRTASPGEFTPRGETPDYLQENEESIQKSMKNNETPTTAQKQHYSRRDVLALAGSAVTVGFAGCLTGNSTAKHGWQRVESPTGKALRSVVLSADGPVAVGESGRVLTRTDSNWETVIQNGPGGASNGLTGADTTSDGKRVWVCGDSGAVGQYAVGNGTMTDRSAPKQKTSSWEDVAVTRAAGNERVRLINGSGELLTGQNQGETIQWSNVTKPTGGDRVNALAARGNASALCDTNGNVYRKPSGGQWQSVGIEDVATSLYDVAMLDADTVTVVGDDGSIFLYNGFNWLSVATAENALHAVDRRNGRGAAVGPGGTVLTVEETKWSSAETPVPKTLHGVALGTVEYADVAVGADGMILENFQ